MSEFFAERDMGTRGETGETGEKLVCVWGMDGGWRLGVVDGGWRLGKGERSIFFLRRTGCRGMLFICFGAR